jgi:hypothetical protein
MVIPSKQRCRRRGVVMMGCQSGLQDRLFYEFCLEDRVLANHLLRKIDRVLKVDRLHE